MTEKQSKVIKSFVLPMAINAGIARIVLDLIPKILHVEPLLYYSTFLIAFIAEIILIRYMLKKFKLLNQNTFSLKQALLIGVTIMVVIGSFYGISSYIYDTYIDPDFQVNTALNWAQMWGGGSEKEIMDKISQRPSGNKFTGVLFTILWFTFVGFVTSFITGIVVGASRK
ncbi:hypothetical protein MNBD_BACTEROID03-2759 [hydrothermal vent metagenome]|uniref:DUF4199 domain-containing protein n=1 Tax=hydrothermal vent metagenome TaxID=652676 RepID=A0A3B0TLZ2_9ZZZZ